MNPFFQTFNEVVEKASAHNFGRFPKEARLVLRGRIDYAVERGDLTINEAKILDAKIGEDFTQTYHEAFEVAAFGESDADLAASGL